MNKSYCKKSIVLICGLVLGSPIVYAAAPLWTMEPVSGFSPTLTISSNATATIKYLVTNRSHKAHTLQMQPIAGISSAGCNAALGYNQSCILSLIVNGSALRGDVNGGPLLCNQGNPLQCYQPAPANSLAIHLIRQPATLTPSVATLALAINCQPASACTTTQNAALTGNPRHITIQNTGSVAATNVTVTALGLPAGTSITSNSCSGTLSAGSFCVITLTPGAVASADSNQAACTTGTAPIGGSVTISADNTIAAQVVIYVLGYGCQYQGGFLYAVDDTTANSDSIGGKVAALVDQANPIRGAGVLWSSNGSSGHFPDTTADIIPLISDTHTNDSYSTAQTHFNSLYLNANIFPFPPASAFAACNATTDGVCDSANILTLYTTYITNSGTGLIAPGPTNPAYYAAGVCTAVINNYADWFLPAICELDAVHGSCQADTQSMLISLAFLIGNPNAANPSTSCSPPSGTTCLAGGYWSSTQTDGTIGNTASHAWSETFDSPRGSSQTTGEKFLTLGIRCARALTP